MKSTNDGIMFENRFEIDEITNALDQYIQEHPNTDGKDTIKKMIGILDVVYMNW